MYMLETDNRILLKLEKGEEVNSSIEQFVGERNLPNAMVFGIGAIQDVELGAYSVETGEYTRELFDHGGYELVSMIGNVGYVGGAAYLHTHVAISGHDFKVWGGHMFSSKVYATVEITIWPGQTRLTRKMDDAIGLKLWNLPHECGASPF